MFNIVILASGSGSNAEAIFNYFKESKIARIKLVISNNKDAGVLTRAKKHGISSKVINSAQTRSGELLKTLQENNTDLLVLAGYMKLIPKEITTAYPKRILNIHPALLPKFGGKGMYGINVHRAVVASGESQSGMTIHFVNEKYDDGAIIFQESVSLSADDKPEDVAAKVLKLEHKNYPPTINKVLKSL